MAHHLPDFIDHYFGALQRANFGKYEPIAANATPRSRNMKQIDSLANHMQKAKR